MHVHNSLSMYPFICPVLTLMYCAGRYQWEMDFESAYLTLITYIDTQIHKYTNTQIHTHTHTHTHIHAYTHIDTHAYSQRYNTHILT